MTAERGAARKPLRVRVYEHRGQPLLPRGRFVQRVAFHFAIALAFVAGSLGIGMVGYARFEGLGWLDAFLNAAMLLGGMGPVEQPSTRAGKLFAGAYALYAGLVFLVVAGLAAAPFFHRLVHRFHLDDEE